MSEDEILARFMEWTSARGFELYEAQEEALLEIMSGAHVILNTPTGPGKSLVATGMHFLALCQGKRSFYTSPIKALVSEKFFELCEIFGAAQVGMTTGDVTINRDAPITCATAEVLANVAMCDGASANVDFVVMDEFHYFSDPARGRAWQLPLLSMPRARFLLMSATLGETTAFEEKIEEVSGAPVSVVRSDARPVPLHFEYSERPIHEAITTLLEQDRAPIYVVHFSQREASELAQDLVSLSVSSRAERDAIGAELGTVRFDSVYGAELKRILKSGVGLHHAGLLPKYRRLVERLAQRGMLKVVCGTDTLGVGINVPIRTVLFSKLCKYDGQKTARLTVRDFQQIAGRAGRRGHDTRGWVMAQAPAHVIENLRLEAKAKAAGKKKFTRKSAPTWGFVPWDRAGFEALASGTPERLTSQLSVDHGMILQFLQRPPEDDEAGYRGLVRCVRRSYERAGVQARLLRRAATLFRALRMAGVLALAPGPRGGARVVVREGTETDFSMFHALSLWLVETAEQLDTEHPDHAFDVITLCECLAEQPQVILKAQTDRARAEMVAKLKEEGVDYETRRERLEAVSYPKPLEEAIYASFNDFRARYVWAQALNVRPKSIAREMYERRMSFNELVRELGIKRAEGVLLRYLNEISKIMERTVPERCKTEDVRDATAYLKVLVTSVDRSLMGEWNALRDAAEASEASGAGAVASSQAPRRESVRAVVRAQLHAVVAALHAEDFARAASLLREDPDSGEAPWDAARLESTLAPFIERYGPPRWDHAARAAHHTSVETSDPERWRVRQTLTDPEGHDEWVLEGHVDPNVDDTLPLVTLIRVGI